MHVHASTTVSVPSGASTFFCEHCGNSSQFLNPTRAAAVAAVSRSTVYYWMSQGWVHWRILPSKRRVVCVQSLSRPVESAETETQP
jgi:predicted DNA-binding transcriptional regulator AlpA